MDTKASAWFSGWPVTKGSDTSGNWLHKGRRGKHGGSMPGGGHRAMGIASGASAEDIKETVAQHRDEKAKQDPRKIGRGDYIWYKGQHHLGGQVVGTQQAWGKSSYMIRTRGGEVYPLPKDKAEKITPEQAVKQHLAEPDILRAPRAQPAPSPKKLPKGASFYARTIDGLNSEFKFKLQQFKAMADRVLTRVKQGKIGRDEAAKRIKKINDTIDAARGERDRLIKELNK